jgi:hypothetical protein
VSRFLAALQALPDCHRICETITFIDEYDGEWEGQPEEQLEKIRQRLLDKFQVEL